MENFENLSQEELLEAAQKAYDEQANAPVPCEQPPCQEEEEPVLEKTEQFDPLSEEPLQADEEPALGDEPPEEETASLPLSVSTNGTAIGIAAGLVLGAGVGFLTGKVAACLTIGVLLGVLLGLFFDVKKDKRAATPKTEEKEVPAQSILGDTIQEDE